MLSFLFGIWSYHLLHQFINIQYFSFLYNVETYLAIVSLIGMAFTSRHETRILGFLVCSVGNILWLYWILNGNSGSLLLFGGYLLFNLIGVHDESISWMKIREFNKKR
jgi:uncharacterized membrane protein